MLRREIGRIGQELEENLLQPLPVGVDRAKPRRRCDLQGDVHFLQAFGNLLGHLVEEAIK